MLSYLLDEDVRGPLWTGILHHNLRGSLPLDATRVGDSGTPQLAASDSEILLWAEAHRRVLVSRDKSTLPNHLVQHMARGHHCPGIFIVRACPSIVDLIDFLVLAAYASEPNEWQDRIEFIG